MAGVISRTEDWNSLPWKHIQRNVFRLQQRIYRAAHHDDVKRVHNLQTAAVVLLVGPLSRRATGDAGQPRQEDTWSGRCRVVDAPFNGCRWWPNYVTYHTSPLRCGGSTSPGAASPMKCARSQSPPCLTRPIRPWSNWHWNRSGKPASNQTHTASAQDAPPTTPSKPCSTSSASSPSSSSTLTSPGALTASPTTPCSRNSAPSAPSSSWCAAGSRLASLTTATTSSPRLERPRVARYPPPRQRRPPQP